MSAQRCLQAGLYGTAQRGRCRDCTQVRAPVGQCSLHNTHHTGVWMPPHPEVCPTHSQPPSKGMGTGGIRKPQMYGRHSQPVSLQAQQAEGVCVCGAAVGAQLAAVRWLAGVQSKPLSLRGHGTGACKQAGRRPQSVSAKETRVNSSNPVCVRIVNRVCCQRLGKHHSNANASYGP